MNSPTIPEPTPALGRELADRIRSRFTGTMPVVCNWCPVPHQIGSKPCLAELDGQISHGICTEALAKTMKEA